ncbi:D-amino acid aminotransferase [Pleionea sp. CnH1-48]|uniref:D-amino acid aminotransferase n=1 Tax=Pleionea sp. CnH1-48 TaxID=2954494 RepID=UPI002098082A|nr:D-amino acid aminotransferase [Pleionea sp. CnH1-48]MCO7227375.1 D-amino acid aminotransferase [Pleionea sp. CnH1-48]
MDIVYLNGQYLPRTQASVSVMDRGFLLGDGIYEVIPCYAGQLFRLEQHLVRLKQSLEAVYLELNFDWQAVIESLLQKNGAKHCCVYLQVTRGAPGQREHRLIAATPTVYIMLLPLPEIQTSLDDSGISLQSVEDIRWQRCDIKSTSLMANCLMKEMAVQAGADDALLIRDGYAIESAAANIFIVKNGVIKTPAKSHQILAGITRDLVVEIARDNGIPLEETLFSLNDVLAADEVWVTSSTREVCPVIRVDDQPIGSGKAGPVWRQLANYYLAFKHKLYRGEIR